MIRISFSRSLKNLVTLSTRLNLIHRRYLTSSLLPQTYSKTAFTKWIRKQKHIASIIVDQLYYFNKSRYMLQIYFDLINSVHLPANLMHWQNKSSNKLTFPAWKCWWASHINRPSVKNTVRRPIQEHVLSLKAIKCFLNK